MMNRKLSRVQRSLEGCDGRGGKGWGIFISKLFFLEIVYFIILGDELKSREAAMGGGGGGGGACFRAQKDGCANARPKPTSLYNCLPASLMIYSTGKRRSAKNPNWGKKSLCSGPLQDIRALYSVHKYILSRTFSTLNTFSEFSAWDLHLQYSSVFLKMIQGVEFFAVRELQKPSSFERESWKETIFKRT